jgi:hypothetical protein
VELYLNAFLTSALDGGEWSASRPGRFIPRERAPGTRWIGGWMGPRVGLDAVVKRKIPTPCRDSNPHHPAHSRIKLYFFYVSILGILDRIRKGHMSRDSSIGIASGYGLTIGWSGFDSRRGLGIFLFDTVSRPTRPTIQWCSVKAKGQIYLYLLRKDNRFSSE